MKIHHDEQGVFIREFVGLFVDGNSWGYSWMAIREFVGLFVDGNSWGYSWMAIRGASLTAIIRQDGNSGNSIFVVHCLEKNQI